MLERERDQVARVSRELAARGLVLGTAGNVSARAGELVAISPTGADLSALQAEHVAVVELDGRQRDGDLEPTSEVDLHLGLYRRFDAGGVIHTHAPYATALACVLDDELPLIHYSLLALGGAVRIAPYATFGTSELHEATLNGLEGRTAVLMASHGTLAYGLDVDRALAHTQLLEWGSELYWRAAAIGTPRTLDAQQRDAAIEAVRSRGYGTTHPRRR